MSARAEKRRIPVICGPTAGGKSDLGVRLAHAARAALGAPGEIVTADAFQVYRGLDIGTAKPSTQERDGVPHHLIDLVDPRTGAIDDDAPAESYRAFTVDRWLELATQTIGEIRGRGALPIVVGGTHLYVKALLDGLFEGPEPDAALRAELSAMDAVSRRAELERVDPAAAARIHPNDSRRTIRALEVYRQVGRPISELQSQWDREASQEESEFVLVGLDWPAELINPRINARVRQMIERGLVHEARELHGAGSLGPQAREALGYKQLIDHFEHRCSLEDAVEQTKIETRRFAKNQRTWMRRLRTRRDSIWIDAAGPPSAQWAEMVLEGL